MYRRKETLILSIFSLIFVINLYFSVQKWNLKSNSKRYFVFDSKMNETNNNFDTIPDVIRTTLSDLSVKHAYNYHDATIVFTNKLDDIENLRKMRYSKKCKWIYGLRSINMLCSKSVLALVIRNYNNNKFKYSIPKTYVISHRPDYIELMNREFDPKSGKPLQPLLLKKNIQRQNGIKFVLHKDDIQIEDGSNNNVVCQVLLTNPYLMNSRKINMRIYLLIICDNSLHKTFAYIYNDGFMYYTKEHFSMNEVNHDTQITTGYIDRKVYQENPLTISEFIKTKLKKDEEVNFRKSLVKLFKDVLQCYKPIFEINEFDHGPNHFVLLGCDIAPDENLDLKLLEINKGPDLTFKDRRDEKLKRDMVKNALSAVVNSEYKTIPNYINVL